MEGMERKREMEKWGRELVGKDKGKGPLPLSNLGLRKSKLALIAGSWFCFAVYTE